MGIFDFDTDKTLRLDAAHKKIGGVCSGIASYCNVRRLYIRIAAVAILCIKPLAAIAGYGLAYLILDDEPDSDARDSEAEAKAEAEAE